MSLRAFTLIELLVVVAIVATLAAILFPVFAQAKAAAKKTACLSNLKQVGTADFLYAADNEDFYPIAFPRLAQTSRQWNAGWQWNGFTYTPADWDAGQTADFVQASASAWPNSTMPYLRSWEALGSPVQKIMTGDDGYGILAAPAAKPRKLAHYAINGSLSSYSGSAVASPSRLISVWQGYGPLAVPGVGQANPTLYCPNADEPCTYKAAPKDGSCGVVNGDAGIIWWWFSAWAHGRGINVAMADGSAAYRAIGANLHGLTDFRKDPYVFYDETGTPGGTYYDDAHCHPILFRPDFDFADFGHPTY